MATRSSCTQCPSSLADGISARGSGAGGDNGLAERTLELMCEDHSARERLLRELVRQHIIPQQDDLLLLNPGRFVRERQRTAAMSVDQRVEEGVQLLWENTERSVVLYALMAAVWVERGAAPPPAWVLMLAHSAWGLAIPSV